jgi:hypothetical protein
VRVDDFLIELDQVPLSLVPGSYPDFSFVSCVLEVIERENVQKLVLLQGKQEFLFISFVQGGYFPHARHFWGLQKSLMSKMGATLGVF